MEMLALRCPSCGGSLKVDAAAVRGWCPFCNTEFLIETARQLGNAGYGGTIESRLANIGQLMRFGEWYKAEHASQQLCNTMSTDYRCWYYQARAISHDGTMILTDSSGSLRDESGRYRQVYGGQHIPHGQAMECLRRAESLVPAVMAGELQRFRNDYLTRVREANLRDCEVNIPKLQEVIDKDRSDTPEYREAAGKEKEYRSRIDSLDRAHKLTEWIFEYTAEWRFTSMGMLAFTALVYWATARWGGGLGTLKAVCILVNIPVFLYAWFGLLWRRSLEDQRSQAYQNLHKAQKTIEACKMSGRAAENARKDLALTEANLARLKADPELYRVKNE